jgi:hypothetical protein
MKNKIYFYFPFLLFLNLLVSCDGVKPKEVDTALLEMPDDFAQFYTQFHQDSSFQMESIIWPLPGRPNGYSDEEIRLSGGFKWTPDVWVMHRPFEDEKNEFEREFEYFAGVIIEFIRVKGTGIGMERRFSKIGDKWMLIYYSAINIISESDSTLEEQEKERDSVKIE